jgi:PBP1b-binding outer membrane lipoprotein LpoB
LPGVVYPIIFAVKIIKPVTMKKLIALLAVCGFALAFVACGKKAEPAAEAVDSTATTTEEVVVDSASEVVDSAAVDSTAVH